MGNQSLRLEDFSRVKDTSVAHSTQYNRVDNPDTQYFLVPLEAGSSYVLTGKRDAHGPIDSNFSFSSLDQWSTLGNIGHKQLQIAADGAYTITLDATPARTRLGVAARRVVIAEGRRRPE